MCKYFDDPFVCEFHDECNQGRDGICIDEQLCIDAEHQRRTIEATRHKLVSEPTLIGTIMENAAPPELVLSKFMTMLKESGTAIRIIKQDDGSLYALLGPFDCADNYIVTALCGGGL